MINSLKKNSTTFLIIIATVILAGIAVFTAIRLYQLRQTSISPAVPESEPKAWDCEKYNFVVDETGNVKVINNSSKSVALQQAKVYINNQLIATLDVPSLDPGQSANIGKVNVPQGGFDWRVVGTVDCQDSGRVEGQISSCEAISFTITTETTPTPTPTPTSTLTPTATPTGTVTPTPTSTPGATATPTSTSTPTPTRTIAETSPTPSKPGAALPEAGIPIPTLIIAGLGLMFIVWAVLLVI